MGIKGLQRLLTVTQSTFPYVKYRTKIMAIDVNILIYKFSYIYHNSIAIEKFIDFVCLVDAILGLRIAQKDL